MAIEKDASGRRRVEAAVDVNGTPEQVWEAIASGPGISAWFVPAEVDGRVGGQVVCHFGPGDSMDSVATVTEWDPPRRFVAETVEEPGTVATEWTVEAKAGGTCTVRVVHSWFASTDDWDRQFEGHSEGWQSFFKILRVYVEHFAGQRGTLVPLSAQYHGPLADAFERVAGPMGVTTASAGEVVTPAGDLPALAGTVIEVQDTADGFSVMLRLTEPAPGIAHAIGFPMGGPVHVSLRFYLYGDDAAGRAPAIETAWRTWLEGTFPAD